MPVNLQRAVDEQLLIDRVFTVRADDLRENPERTIECIFSTEYEYVQWFGREMLSHDENAIDLQRMIDKTAPVLLNHSRQQQIGVVENARLVNRQGIATLRFSRSALGEEVYRDILDGIRSQISCGYRIMKWEVDESRESDPLYTITEWQPYEVSVVTLNADPTALVQRDGYFNPTNDDEGFRLAGEPVSAERGKPTMKKKRDLENTNDTPEVVNDTPAADVNVASFAIYARGQEEGEQALAMEVIGERGSLEDFEQALKTKREQMAAEAAKATDAERDDLIEERFNLSDLIFQTLNPGAERGKRALEEARDLTSDAEKTGYVAQGGGVIIPHSRLTGESREKAQRDLTTGSSSGGDLIGTDVRGDLFIESLRNNMVMGDLVTMITDLRGNVAIPAETTAPTAAWKGENVANTESDPVIGQITFSPKFVRGFTEVSRTLIAQSSVDTEMVVRNSLMKGVGLVVDKAILTGTGASDQPSGVDSISNIDTTTYATAISNATVANLVAVEKALDDANAPEMNRAWVVAPDVRAHFRQKPIATGGIPAWYNGMLLDSPGYVTAQVSSGEAYYGAWSEAFLALWDSVEILVNPYSGDTTGLVRITAWQLADIGFAHGGSFAKLKQA